MFFGGGGDDWIVVGGCVWKIGWFMMFDCVWEFVCGMFVLWLFGWVVWYWGVGEVVVVWLVDVVWCNVWCLWCYVWGWIGVGGYWCWCECIV